MSPRKKWADLGLFFGMFLSGEPHAFDPTISVLMHVAFLVPDIHDRPTGGNIYNRRIITELQGGETVTFRSWQPGAESPPPIDSPDGIVLDSLLVRHDNALRVLREVHPTASLVLLAHYLHCIDPNERDSSAATTERTVLSLFDGVVTTSEYARRALTDEGVPEEQIAVVPPGLDDTFRAPVPDRPDRETIRLLTVANLLPGKGLSALVEVLGTLEEADWAWTLVGDDALDPDFADRLHEQIQASPVADRITCTGAVPTAELRAQYDNADVFVLPSRFETCSMATREAMARGLPVVGFDVGGLSENLDDAATARGAATSSGAARPQTAPAGFLVSPNAPAVIADVLRSLLSNPSVRARMGHAARERSRAFPTWPTAAAQFWTALRNLRS